MEWERFRVPRELLHDNENYTPTLMTLLPCSVDVPRSPVPFALTMRTKGVGCARLPMPPLPSPMLSTSLGGGGRPQT
jgi:hypothetical protein